MASSNLNNQSAGSFSFVTPIKLGNKNFIAWRAHILTLIKGNCLESFINSNRPCPVQFLPHETTGARSSTGSYYNRGESRLYNLDGGRSIF